MITETTLTAYAIQRLAERVKLLNRRASRLGCEKLSLTVGEYRTVTLEFSVPLPGQPVRYEEPAHAGG